MNLELNRGKKEFRGGPPDDLIEEWNRIIGLPEEPEKDKGREAAEMQMAAERASERSLTTRTAMQRYYTDQTQGGYYQHQQAAYHVTEHLGGELDKQKLEEIEDEVRDVKREVVRLKRELQMSRMKDRHIEQEITRQISEKFPDFDEVALERIIVQAMYGNLKDAGSIAAK